MKHIKYCWSSNAGWLSVFGYGLWFKSPTCSMLFSERHGYMKKITVMGWRIGLLKP